jgi:Holliday junction resolvase RusA-like endonuclease
MENNQLDIILEGVIYTPPKTKQRPRLTRRGKAYNPEATRVAQKNQAMFFKGAAFKSGKKFPLPQSLALEVHLTFYHYGKSKKKIVPKLTTPDIDNLCKLTLDAMTDAGLWKTDSQITKLVTEDLWAGKDGKSRIEFVIKEHRPQIEKSEETKESKAENSKKRIIKLIHCPESLEMVVNLQ